MKFCFVLWPFEPNLSCLCLAWGGRVVKDPVGCLNIKMLSYHFRNSHGKDKTVSQPSCLYNGTPYMQRDSNCIDKMVSWPSALKNGNHYTQRYGFYREIGHSFILKWAVAGWRGFWGGWVCWLASWLAWKLASPLRQLLQYSNRRAERLLGCSVKLLLHVMTFAVHLSHQTSVTAVQHCHMPVKVLWYAIPAHQWFLDQCSTKKTARNSLIRAMK